MFTLILDETLKETTVQGTRDFPFSLYIGGVNDFAEGYLDWHWHDNFEINLVTSGTLHYFVENEEYLLQEGDAIFINSCRLHRGYSEIRTQNSDTLVFGSELFCNDSASSWYTSYLQYFIQSDVNGLHLTDQVPWMGEVLAGLKTISHIYREDPYAASLSIKGHLCTVFADILNHTAHDSRVTPLESEKRKRIRLLLSYIAQNYMHAITLEELASVAGLSETECSRFFTAQMKQAPFSYLHQYRIERSCELLVTTDLPISEIALQTGFNSFSYYSKRFREHMHCTPSEYRRKILDARK